MYARTFIIFSPADFRYTQMYYYTVTVFKTNTGYRQEVNS